MVQLPPGMGIVDMAIPRDLAKLIDTDDKEHV